jgi:hypothetical protein
MVKGECILIKENIPNRRGLLFWTLDELGNEERRLPKIAMGTMGP